MASTYKLYGYRWVVLAVFMFINLTIQMLWITYAPITGPAATFYGVSDLQIGLLAMSFMIAFIPLSIPVSWVIDTYGFKLAVSIGAVLMRLFGFLRGLAGANYSLVLWSTIGIAAAQPFLLNAWTKVPANWFAMEERATTVLAGRAADGGEPARASSSEMSVSRQGRVSCSRSERSRVEKSQVRMMSWP